MNGITPPGSFNNCAWHTALFTRARFSWHLLLLPAITAHLPARGSRMSNSNDFPLVKRPPPDAKAYFPSPWCCSALPFSPARCFAGGKLGVSFSIVNLLWIAVIGNALLALYAASLGWIAARSGLNTVLMGRFCFGEIGSKLADLFLALPSWGWYAWGTATVAISLVKILALPEARPAVDGAVWYLFCVTALVGYKGLDALSRLSVPLMFVLLMVSMYLALHHAGGWRAMTALRRATPPDGRRPSVFRTSPAAAPGDKRWTRLANSAGPPFSPAWAASSSATG